MFDFLWRWLGGSGGNSGRPRSRKPSRDDDDSEPLDPAAEREWIEGEQRAVADYLAAVRPGTGAAELAWKFPRFAAIWSVPGGWVLTGELGTHHVFDAPALASARDAARFFARQFRERSGGLPLSHAADALMASVRYDDGWADPRDPADDARRIDAALRSPLFDTSADPELRAAVRILTKRKSAPGGDHVGVYVYLDLAGKPGPRLFDAVARRMIALDAQVAPLVAHRVLYALVVFGIDFGQPTAEIDACFQVDQMRARNPELSRRIDLYGLKGSDVLSVHFVDRTDQPFTAHPCQVRPPGKPYTAEEKYFNCRDQEFHGQMEASPQVAFRLIAASIDADVVAAARHAFR